MPEAVKEEFDWITLRQDLDKRVRGESATEKFKRKVKENPYVPLGCLLTTAALTYGLWSFRKGDSKKSQLMMRFRIGAQGFTIAALIFGLAAAAAKK